MQFWYMLEIFTYLFMSHLIILHHMLPLCRTLRKKKKDAATAALTPEAQSAAACLVAEEAYLDGLKRLLDFFKVKDVYKPPEQRRTVNDDILLAAKTRELMDSKCINIICACCSRPRPRGMLYTGHPVGDGGLTPLDPLVPLEMDHLSVLPANLMTLAVHAWQLHAWQLGDL
jgi:hypothetical protein